MEWNGIELQVQLEIEGYGYSMTEKYSRKTFRLRLEEMTSQLRDEILSGKRSPGDFLPSELDLSRQFHISNKTVRQGLDVLFQEGLIEKIPKIGSRVASPSADGRVVVRFGYHNTIIREMELTQMLTEFHRLHPHIRVQALEIPRNNYYRFVKEYMDSGMLDVVTINYNNFKEFTDNDTAGLFEPLPIQKETYAFLRNIFQYRDVVLALPLVFSPIILCYNKQHFAEKGIAEPDSSWTWDILLEHAEQLAVENERF
ncbi:MAG: GntR family transcriptional regulator, partial [Paenibacillus sp.]|nr:GntR family transcriptional regulator [Paenibacillus sp.]